MATVDDLPGIKKKTVDDLPGIKSAIVPGETTSDEEPTSIADAPGAGGEVGPDSSGTSLLDKIKRSFEIAGEMKQVNYAAHNLSQEALFKILRDAGRIDNAIATGFKRNQEVIDHVKSGGKLPPPEGGFISGLRAGFLYEEENTYKSLVESEVLGPEMAEKINDYRDSHLITRVPNTIAELGMEMVAGTLVDGAILQTIKPIKALTRSAAARASFKFQGPEIYTKKFWNQMSIPDRVVKEGRFDKYLDHAALKMYDDANSVDEILKANMAMGDEVSIVGNASLEGQATTIKKLRKLIGRKKDVVTEGGKIVATKADAPKGKSINLKSTRDAVKKIEKKNAKLTKDLTENVQPKLLRREAEVKALVEKSDSIPADLRIVGDNDVVDLTKSMNALSVKQKQVSKLRARKRHIIDQLSSNSRDIDIVYRRGAFTPNIDYQKATRAIREDFVDRVVKSRKPDIANKSFTKGLDEAVKGVTNGRRHFTAPKKAPRKGASTFGRRKGRFFDHRDLNLLSDDEFMAIFDYVPYLVRDPKTFKSTFFAKGGAIRSGLEFLFDWGAPADRWFDINNAGEIIKSARQADLDAMRSAIRYEEGWDELLKRNFGKKARGNKPLQEAIWEAADGNMEMALDVIQRNNLRVVLAEVIEAANYINKTFDEIADIFEAQGRWADGLKRERTYIRHIVKRGVEESSGDFVRISKMVEPFDRALNTKIDIKEFINRTKAGVSIVKNADASFRSGLGHEIYKLHWEPSINEMKSLANLTGNDDIINYTQDFIKYAIRGEVTPTERFLEPLFGKVVGPTIEKGVGFPRKVSRTGQKAIQKVIPPLRTNSAFNRFYEGLDGLLSTVPGATFKTERRATRQILAGWRTATFHGALAARPQPAIRNAFQGLLSIPLANHDSYFKGLQSLFTDGGQTLSIKHNNLLIGRTPGDFDIRTFKGFTQAAHTGFRFVDRVPNVKGNFNTYVRHLITKDKDKLKTLENYGFRGRLNDVGDLELAASKAFDDGALLGVKEAANALTRISQYSYRPIAQPKFMTHFGPLGRTVGQFTTWPSNYWFSYMPELSKRFLTGTDSFGNPLTLAERSGLATHLGRGAAIFIAGQSMGVDLYKLTTTGAVPTGVGPFWDFMVGGIDVALSSARLDKDGINKGLRRMEKGLTFMKLQPVPHPSLLIQRDIEAVLDGDKPFKSLLFKVKKEEPLKKPKSLSGGFIRRKAR